MASYLDQLKALFVNGDKTRNVLSILALVADVLDVHDKANISVVSSTTYTLTPDDNGKTLLFQNAAGCTVTVPNSLGAGFTVLLVQDAAGQVTVAAGAGVSFLVSAAHIAPFKTADQGSQLSLQQLDAQVRVAIAGNLA